MEFSLSWHTHHLCCAVLLELTDPTGKTEPVWKDSNGKYISTILTRSLEQRQRTGDDQDMLVGVLQAVPCMLCLACWHLHREQAVCDTHI